MAVSAFLRCFVERVGVIIISVYTAYIAWKGLICVANGHDGTEQQLIGWTDQNSLVLASAGAWTLWPISFLTVEKSGP
jgi:hypothetical protein